MSRGTSFAIEVNPAIPERLARLEELANNLWYSWDRPTRALFARLDTELWNSSGHSPKAFLKRVEERRLVEASLDDVFLGNFNRVVSAYDTYHAERTPQHGNRELREGDLIAYFCAEFGLHESLPIYSGGLGILAGDHCKAASDLRLPFVAVGLLYRQGYFSQTIDGDGAQKANYADSDFEELPVVPVLDAAGAGVRVQVELPGRAVHAKVWRAQVGHLALYLLDTDVEENSERDRDIGHRLYGGDRATRIEQELVLGVGGVRALENVDLSLKLAAGERRNSGYQIVPAIAPPENPLLRKYNLANRSRESAGLRADIAATETIQIGLGLDTSRDRYKDSSIGLTGGRDFSLNGDVSAMLTAQTSLHAFANHQLIKSQQAGSQAFANPDWSAQNRDTVDVLGFGVRHAAIKDKFELGADYAYTRTRSAIQVDTGAANPPFPDLSTSMHGLKLYATYRIDAQLSLHGGYWYERYSSANWMLDGVTAATIPNVLTFGEQPPQYQVHLIRASLRYQF